VNATPQLAPGIAALLGEITARLLAEGARAVVLAGSHVRGTPHPESDIDLHALGDGPEYRLSREGRHLVSISWTSPEAVRSAFASPPEAVTAVPAWRDALPLADPEGIVATLRSEARAWTWDTIGNAACDTWVAEDLCGYAEEVHKLVTNLARGHPRTAAIQRSVLALRLARIMAVHLRLLCRTEDEMWDAVAARLGPDWERAQSASLSENGEPLPASCAAALELFALAARRVMPLLDARQRAVVTHACVIAGYRLT
jgi:hypothetical protein